MDAATIIVRARQWVDDNENPQFATDAEYLVWVDEAAQEACRRGRFLMAKKQISVVANTSTYSLPSDTILVRRAKLSSEILPLQETSYLTLDEDVSGWESETGTPLEYFTDMETDKITLYPTPDANNTLDLVTITEHPAITQTTDTPLIPTRFHNSLVHWLCYRYFQRFDEDTNNEQRAEYHRSLFVHEFGERSSAKDEIFQLRNRPFNNFDGGPY